MKQRRSLVFFLLGLAALIAGFTSGRELWFTIAYLVGLLLIISFVWAWINLRWTRISRVTRSRRTQVGQPLEERITVTNTGRLPKLWLEVRDHSTLPGHYVSRVVSGLPAKRRYTWTVSTVGQVRGRYRLGPMLIRTGDPFGLFPLERPITATNNVVVYPLTIDIPGFPAPPGVLSGGDALRRRVFQVTANAAGVRDYAPGDSFSRIHWASTARRDRLIVKEFELDPLADVWIIADMAATVQAGRIVIAQPPLLDLESEDVGLLPFEERPAPTVGTLPRSTEEYVVTLAASLGQYFLRQDRAVGMLANGQSGEFVQPDRGERQLNRILETLAVLRAEGTLELSSTLLTQSNRFQRGTTLIVITPTTDERWAVAARELGRRGLRCVTVLVDPVGFSSERSADLLLAQMHRYGLPVYRINYGDDLAAVLSGRLKS